MAGGGLGSTYFISSATGNYYDDAKQRGMNDKEAKAYSGTMGIIEGSLESLGAKLTTNVGKQLLKRNIKESLINYGLDIGENFLEEGIIEPISELVAQTTGGKDKANWDNIGERILKSGIDGAVTSIITGGTSGIIGAIGSKVNNSKGNITDSYGKAPVSNEIMANNETILNKNIEPAKLNYYESAKKYNIDTNNNTVKGLYEVANKRGIDVYYNDEVFANSKQNAKWLVDKEGNRSVVLNPNANTNSALQSVMIHELTHDIEGTDAYNKINEMVINKLKESGNYDDLMLDIANTYKNEYNNMQQEQFKKIIEQEAVADYLGENLGNQEFVNELVNSQDRSTIKKILDWIKNKIISLKNTITGNEEVNYWNKIRENFENAFNQEYQGDINKNKMSIAGQKGMKNAIRQDSRNIQLERMLNRAQQMQKANIDNETIRRQTNWFQDRNGDWKFEISDKDMSLKSNVKLKKDGTYKLGDILEHDTLFTVYPQLENLSVKFKDMKQVNGSYKGNSITLNNNIIKSNGKTEGTLIHEIQHAIQNIEGFEQGTTSKLSKKSYYENLGEIEADNTKKRFIDEKYKNKNIQNIPPESSKSKPKHSGYDQYIKNRGRIDKIKDSVFKYVKKDGNNDEINQKNMEQTDPKNLRDNDTNIWNRLKESENNTDSFILPKVKNSQNTKGEWQQHLKETSINKGTRETIQDVKLPIVKEPKNELKNIYEQDLITSKKQAPVSKKAEQEKVATILEKVPEKVKEKDRKWAIFKANVFDKGIVFEELSHKTKNRELQGKWDYILTSSARGQNAIGKPRYEFNPQSKKHIQISKSLDSIRQEVGEKVQDFSNYMYHQLNIDRMTLEERFNGDTGINYERKNPIKNKPVFGNSVSAKVSKTIVAEYENKFPEFKEYAKDVYDYNKANMKELVNNGVVSQELADLFEERYPHYVPISRVNVKGKAIKVPLDTNRTGINSPLEKAKGGNQDILPLFETMANRTLQTYKASARNNFGIELMNTLGNIENIEKIDTDNIVDSISDDKDELLKKGSNGNNPTFTVFDKGKKITFEITKDMYDALKPLDESSMLSKTSKIANKISNARRGVLTEYNPIFMITNPVKDIQDVIVNSQHTAKTFAKLPEAYAQIINKGYWYNEYIQHGGEQNSYFNSNDNAFTNDIKKPIAKNIVTFPLRAISKVNNVIEMSPRLAEYIASREKGRSIETSMLDASRVTTNFKAGGNFTKFANRNGATFLNASVQGAMQQVRNIKEANTKGLKGWTVLVCKYTISGLPAVLINNILWADDDDYDELQDYVKDNYYCIAKYGDGKFIRIPKGRVTATIQKIMTTANEYLNGEKEINIDNLSKDFWENIKFAGDNLAPNNPIDNNIISPIIQAVTNTSWYGEEIVPKRLQDKPKAEQYDETTDIISKWIGEKLNVSPKKLNYLLDQYSGGIGDVILPMMTPQAENNMIEDKFTTDSIMKSKYPGEFFEKSQELKVKSNSIKASELNKVQYKYMSNISKEINDLYNEKRKVQNSKDKDDVKKERIKNIQREINQLAKNGVETVGNIKMTNTTAKIGNKEYYKLDDDWKELTDKEKVEGLSLKTYADYKNKVKQLSKQKKESEEYVKSNDKIKILLNSNYSMQEKHKIYSNLIEKDDEIYNDFLSKINLNINEYLKYKSQTFKSEKDENGKTIVGSKKKTIYNYINSLNLSSIEKAILFAKAGYPQKGYKQTIYNYINNLDLSAKEKKKIWEKLGYK